MPSLIEILDSKVIPWSTEWREPRLIMPGPSLRRDELPDGVSVTTKKLRGPRCTIRNSRRLGQEQRLRARWPKDGLVEIDSGPSVICVTGGRVDYQVDEQVIHCGEGNFILVPSGVPYAGSDRPHYDFDPQSPNPSDFCDLFWLTRYSRGIQCWTCHCRGAQHGAVRGQQCVILSEAASQLLVLLLEEASAGQRGWQSVCSDYLHAALTIIRREIAEGKALNADIRDDRKTRHGPCKDPIEEAQHYIRTHLRDAPTIEVVARHVFMSRAQFIRRFRRQTGQSFAEFLTQCRIEEARLLLRGSGWSLARICLWVGLKSLPYFCELFRRHTGMTPQEFRDQQGKHAL
jgi:AraC-like DNA-binding protein